MVEAIHVNAIPATFSALRERLQAQINAPDALSADALRLSHHNGSDKPADSDNDTPRAIRLFANPQTSQLLSNLAAQHHDTDHSKSSAQVSPSVDAIRQSRRRLHLRREMWTRRIRHLQTSMDTIEAEQLQHLQQDTVEYGQHVSATHATALRRLQALFVECITEMDKAVQRAKDAVCTQTTSYAQELHYQTQSLQRVFQWRWFLTRFAEDTRHEIKTWLLVPTAPQQPTQVDHTLLAELTRVVASNGPVLSAGERVVIDSVVAVDGETSEKGGRDDDNNAKPSRPRPSLHFVDSMAAAWTDIVQQCVPSQPSHPAKTKSRPASGRSAGRKPRRPSPPPTGSSSSSTLALFVQAEDGMAVAQLRQVVASPDTQWASFPIDSPLSSSSIRWLLGVEHSQCLRDSCVYAEATSVSETTAIGAITDATGAVYMRATVQELLQTNYFRDQFVKLVDHHDTESLETRFPARLRDQHAIADLFVAMDVHNATTHNATDDDDTNNSQFSTVRMLPLNTVCLHELCVLYIARGTQTSRQTKSRAITSLARADALAVLPPPSTAGAHCCILRHPRGLLRTLSMSQNASQETDWVQRCPAIFVEYHIESNSDAIQSESKSNATAIPTKRQRALTLLGQVCSWRSCRDEATHAAIPPNGVPVCHWHGILQTSLEDSVHFTPSLRDLKACFKPINEDARETETLTKVLLTSSSLLQELSSRQLGQSITSFLDHTKLSLSNATYEETKGYEYEELGPDDHVAMEMDENTVAGRKSTLEIMKQVLAIEQAITAAMRQAQQDGWSMQELQMELREFDADIRTTNFELIRELSRHKLAILQRWLADRESGCGAGAGLGGGAHRMTHSVSDGALSSGCRPAMRDADQETTRGYRDVRLQAQQHMRAGRPKSASLRRP